MELREFIIEIYENVDWEIRLKGLDDYSLIPPFKKKIPDYGFGIYKILDEKIAYIFDIAVRDSDLKLCKDDKMMAEICEFKHNKHKFQGSFIDALEYIKENFK